MKGRVTARRSAEHQRRVIEIRQSNATSSHKSPKDYRRKPKHILRGWAE